MRVCIISTPIFQCPPIGYSGLEALAWLQAKGLAERGHEVTLIAPDGSTCPGVTVLPCGPAGRVDEKTAYSGYWQHLLTVQAVIDNSWCKYSYTLKMERPDQFKAPVLGVCHAPIHTMYQSLPPIEKPCFVCISKDQADHFAALHGRDCRYVYNGIDLQHYQAMTIPRTDRFLFLARFSAIKGADLAIEACKAAGVGLDLVGDTSITNEPEYLERIKSMCDGNQIRLIGPATRGETVKWFSQAKAFLHLNQRFREPLGLAPLEAQACGLMCVTWRYGAMPETVKHGETGYLVTSMDAAVKAIIELKGKNETELAPMRARCRENAKRFSVSNMIDGYEKLINEAISEGGW